MKIIAIFLFILFVLVIQMTVVDGLTIQGIKPDLPFILCYSIGLYKGETRGLILGGFIGFLVDSSTGVLLGLNIISKSTVVFSSDLLRRKIFRVTAIVNLIFLFILSLLDGVINFLLINMFLVTSSLTNAFKTLIFPQAVYNSLIGIFILILTERLIGRRNRNIQPFVMNGNDKPNRLGFLTPQK